MNYVPVTYFLTAPKRQAWRIYDEPCAILDNFMSSFRCPRLPVTYAAIDKNETPILSSIGNYFSCPVYENISDYTEDFAILEGEDSSRFASVAQTEMAKSVSIPIALSELKRVSLQRLSTRRMKKKDTPLNAFVIFVQEVSGSVKLFGSSTSTDGYSVGDEILAVNDFEVEGKDRSELLIHIKESIENRTIQLKVKRHSTDTATEETSHPPVITDAYIVCVDKEDVKKISAQIKQKYPEVRTFDMEEIAHSRLNNITPTTNNVKQVNNGTDEKQRMTSMVRDKNNSVQRQKENEFLRSSQKLKSLAKETKEPEKEVKEEEVVNTGYDNHCYEQPREQSSESIPLKQVIVSVERITEHLSRLEGREEDSRLLMNFFQSPSVRDAIQATAEQHESVANNSCSANGSCVPDNDQLRVVTLFKHEDSYLGATVRNEENRIVVGRVVKGGVVDKMGLLHEGDELLEMNGVELRGKRVDEVCDMLRHTSGQIQFVVAASKEQKKHSTSQTIHLKALFDYDPEDDMYVPCKELALKFERGDVLHVLNTNDENWWQAYRDGEDTQHQLAGLIPSSSFHQQVVMYTEEMERENKPKTKKETKRRIPEVIRTLGRRSSGEILRSADEPPLIGYHSKMLTYEEVSLHLARSSHRRPLILCGPEGVGCLQLRQRLLQSGTNRLASPVPCKSSCVTCRNFTLDTTRAPREGEIDGVHYHFISKQQFVDLSKAGKFAEYGEYQKHLYGTAVDDIIAVINKGLTCVLSLKPESIAAVRIATVMPFIVFIAPPSLHQLRRQRECAGQFDVKDEQLKAILNQGKFFEQTFGHLFDSIVVNVDMDRSQEELLRILKRLETQPQWVPNEWLAKTVNGVAK